MTHATRTREHAVATCSCIAVGQSAQNSTVRSRVCGIYVWDPTFPLLCAPLALLIWSSVFLFGIIPSHLKAGSLSRKILLVALHYRCGPCHFGESCIWNSSRTTGRDLENSEVSLYWKIIFFFLEKRRDIFCLSLNRKLFWRLLANMK